MHAAHEAGDLGLARVAGDSAARGIGYHETMRVLITGISGFVGLHLAEHLLAEHPEVELFGLRRWRSEMPAVPALAPAVRILEGDLLDAPSLVRVLQASRPDVIFHLAASSSVAGSWDTPAEMMQVNALGTLHLLEAVRQLNLDARVVLACSAEAYGVVAESELPIKESQPFRPVSPYAVSKAAVDLLGYQYSQAFGLRTVRMRLFNHCGPRQSARFVVSSLARQIAGIEAGLLPPRVVVGNLDVRRDFVDVRDAARAYWLAGTRGVPGEAYNVATGTVALDPRGAGPASGRSPTRASRSCSTRPACGRRSCRCSRGTRHASARQPGGARRSPSSRRWPTPWTGGVPTSRPDRRRQALGLDRSGFRRP